MIEYFNPRPRVEGDGATKGTVSVDSNFNPRPRVEGDFGIIAVAFVVMNFNPRPRVEGDLFLMKFRAYSSLFQSSPSCGGRQWIDTSIV